MSSVLDSTLTELTKSQELVDSLRDELRQSQEVMRQWEALTPETETIQITLPAEYRILKEDEEGKPIVIAGYASVNIVDKDQQRIPITALQNAFGRFMNAGEAYQNVMLIHSNIQIGKVIPEYEDNSGKLWKSKVDENGMFVVCEIRSDIKKGREVIQLIKEGKLKAFSIGGEVLKKKLVNAGRIFESIEDFDLHEVTVCPKGKNPAAVFKIIKQDVNRKSVDELTREYFQIDKEVWSEMTDDEKNYYIEQLPEPSQDFPSKPEDKTKDIDQKGDEVVKDDLIKRVVKRGNQYCVIHCTGADAGKSITCKPTREQALAVHRAIMANKGVGTGQIDPKDLVGKADQPPKDWWNSCTSKAKSFADNPDAFCNWLWRDGPSGLRSSFGKTEVVGKEDDDESSSLTNIQESQLTGEKIENKVSKQMAEDKKYKVDEKDKEEDVEKANETTDPTVLEIKGAIAGIADRLMNLESAVQKLLNQEPEEDEEDEEDEDEEDMGKQESKSPKENPEKTTTPQVSVPDPEEKDKTKVETKSQVMSPDALADAMVKAFKRAFPVEEKRTIVPTQPTKKEDKRAEFFEWGDESNEILAKMTPMEIAALAMEDA